MSALSPDNTIISLKSLVTHDLHYCCLWAFFSLYEKPGLIALRLGLSRQAVHKHKRRFVEGEYKCERCPRCLAPSLESLRQKLPGSSALPPR